MQLYSHNISGGKSKISNINHSLATTQFDIICIQETWFDSTIDSMEIIASTNFNIYRYDRSSSLSSKEMGGGLVTFVRNDIVHFEVILKEKTLIESQAIRVKVGSAYYVVLNVYIPPDSTRPRMVDELNNQILIKFTPNTNTMKLS